MDWLIAYKQRPLCPAITPRPQMEFFVVIRVSLSLWLPRDECLVPQVHMLKPDAQCDGVRRWGLWEAVRSWGGEPSRVGLLPLQQGLQKLPHPSHWRRTRSVNQEANPIPQIPNLPAPYLGLPASRMVRNARVLLQPPRVCHCVRAVLPAHDPSSVRLKAWMDLGTSPLPLSPDQFVTTSGIFSLCNVPCLVSSLFPLVQALLLCDP